MAAGQLWSWSELCSFSRLRLIKVAGIFDMSGKNSSVAGLGEAALMAGRGGKL